ncbi:MAG TPA: hypothetical protein DD656_03080, partial [Alphaproteobacteria bacterium]|nr:hypothetical protein [Alphaproteobacteria bacterium]
MGDQKANNSSNDMGMLNTVKLANNMAQAQAHLQRIQADLAAFHMDPEGPVQMDPLNLGDTFKTFVTLMQEHPHEIANAQYQLFSQYQELCQNMMARMNGEQVEPLITPERGDRRFKDEGWNHDIFDFMKQAYLITAKWADATLKDIDGKLPVRDKRKVEFYAKQFMDALAPSNFMLTNPQVLREFMAT